MRAFVYIQPTRVFLFSYILYTHISLFICSSRITYMIRIKYVMNCILLCFICIRDICMLVSVYLSIRCVCIREWVSQNVNKCFGIFENPFHLYTYYCIELNDQGMSIEYKTDIDRKWISLLFSRFKLSFIFEVFTLRYNICVRCLNIEI